MILISERMVEAMAVKSGSCQALLKSEYSAMCSLMVVAGFVKVEITKLTVRFLEAAWSFCLKGELDEVLLSVFEAFVFELFVVVLVLLSSI